MILDQYGNPTTSQRPRFRNGSMYDALSTPEGVAISMQNTLTFQKILRENPDFRQKIVNSLKAGEDAIEKATGAKLKKHITHLDILADDVPGDKEEALIINQTAAEKVTREHVKKEKMEGSLKAYEDAA